MERGVCFSGLGKIMVMFYKILISPFIDFFHNFQSKFIATSFSLGKQSGPHS